MINLYLSDEEEYNRIYNEHSKRLSEYNGIYYSEMNSGNTKTMPTFENHYIDFKNYGDKKLFNDVEETIRYSEKYKQKISSLLQESVMLLYESEEGTYISIYYGELCSYYSKLAGMELDIVETKGWNEFFSLKIPAALLAIALIGTLCGTFTKERRTGMNIILRISKHGGVPTVRAKLTAVIIISAVLSLIFTLAPLSVFALTSGLSSVNRPVQTLNSFQYCPYNLTVGEYLVIYLLLRVIIFTVFSLFAAVVSKLFENEKFAFVAAAVLALSGIFIGNISPTSEYWFLQKYSVSELANINILFTRYRGLNFMGQCVNYTVFMIIAVLAVFIILTIIPFLHNPGGINEFSGEKNIFSSSPKSMPLLKTEFYKQLICGKYIYVVLAAIILKCVVSGIYYFPINNYSEIQYIDYISQVYGKITDEKLKNISDEAEYIADSIADYNRAVGEYRSGKISQEEYQKYKARNTYAEYCEDACKRLCERRDYLLSAAEAHPDVEFIYEEGIKRHLNFSFDVIAIIVILLLASNVFAFEYESGFWTVIRTTYKGRAKLFRAKILYSVITAGALYFIFTLISAAFIVHYYNINFLGAPIQSIPEFGSVKLNISIAKYLWLYQSVSFIGYIACFLLTASLSTVLKSQVKTIVTAMFIVLVPYIVNYAGILNAGIFDFVNMISPKNVLYDAISYISCAALTVFCVVWAKIKWCKKRV